MEFNRLEAVCQTLLTEIGEDVTRPGLIDTPKRWAQWWQEFVEYEPGNTDTTFEHVVTDQMVVVSGIEVWSLCEHHLLPFSCILSIGYIAKGRVLGLSKFARIAHKTAHRLQTQESLIHTLADEIGNTINSQDIAVIGKGKHLCMIMRGIKTPAVMTTSVMRGVFFDKPEARAEFLGLVN